MHKNETSEETVAVFGSISCVRKFLLLQQSKTFVLSIIRSTAAAAAVAVDDELENFRCSHNHTHSWQRVR